MMLDLRRGTCPLCEHDEVLESKVAEFGHSDFEKRMCVTYDARWVASGRNPKYGHGALLLYVCRACGYAQWFAESPGEIPVSSEHQTRIIQGPTGDGPFR